MIVLILLSDYVHCECTNLIHADHTKEEEQDKIVEQIRVGPNIINAVVSMYKIYLNPPSQTPLFNILKTVGGTRGGGGGTKQWVERWKDNRIATFFFRRKILYARGIYERSPFSQSL